VSFLSDESRAWLDRVAELDAAAAASPQSPPPALDRIRAVRMLAAELERDAATLQAVREARASGLTWEDIADAAGLGAAAAKWRWHGTDAEIAERHEAGRKRSARPSSVPTDLPGMSVSEAAKKLGVSAQAVYLRVSRGVLRAETVTLPDGRTYKRVFPDEAPPDEAPGA
jgi:DNA-directed RNA polymerase specialized sigma24 family protein